MKNRLRRPAAAALAAVMLLLSACGGGGDSGSSGLEFDSSYPGKVNETVGSDSKWISSSIDGAIDGAVSVSEKDDFYTAVNKDWILEQTVTEDEPSVWFAEDGTEIVKQRKIDILSGKVSTAKSFEGIDSDELAHDQELVQRFSAAAADWDKRNALGAEPMRKYIEAIEAISTLDEMTAYLCDISGSNFTGECFLGIGVFTGMVDQFNHRILLSPNDSYLLENASAYKNIGLMDMAMRDISSELVSKLLRDLGYGEADTDRLLRKTYELEGRLADHDDTLTAGVALYDKVKEAYTLDDLKAYCGDFPIAGILSSRRMDGAEEYRVMSESYLRFLGRLYTEANLPAMKAFLITHTLKAAAPLLTRTDYEKYAEIEGKSKKDSENDGTGIEGAENNDEWDIVLNDFVARYMSGALDIVYVAQYCSPEQKAQVKELIESIIEAYRGMIDEEEWMSLAAKEATIEKLDYMTVRAIYPDVFETYGELIFGDEDSLPEMVQKINCDNIYYAAERIDMPVDKSRWDMDEYSTTVVNACYMPTDNSINITAGIIVDERVFSTEQTPEQRLATLGTIVGHEITHAFDTTGCQYDKYGVQNKWWDIDDMTSFQLRTTQLVNYYSALLPYPYGQTLNGFSLSGEAIADMGGMKATLRIAKGIKDFDYDLYFRSYAELWKMKTTFEYAERLAKNDVHPLNYLRVNVTVMQFDEFYDTYSVSEGDGMYMAADKRIAVW